MDELIFEQVNEEIFDDMGQAIAVMWWLVHLSGGKIVFPVEEDFWLNYYPQNTRLVLRKENGALVLVAEKQQWTEYQP